MSDVGGLVLAVPAVGLASLVWLWFFRGWD